MKTARVVFAVAAMFATGAMAMDEMKQGTMMMDMNAMDTNHDGMISKQEFMKYNDAMWAKMKKTKAGMVDMKDMAMQDGMMKDGGMAKDGAMMKGGNMAKDGSMMKDGTMAKDGSMMKDGSMAKDAPMTNSGGSMNSGTPPMKDKAGK